MGRDLIICGIEKNKVISLDNSLSDKEISINREHFLKRISELWYEELENNGIIEICYHGSRQICYAICEIVDDFLLENSYGLFDHIAFYDSYYMEMILSKAELLIILDWLIIISQMLGIKKGEFDKQSFTTEINNVIKKVEQNICFSDDEFEWFWCEYGRFCKWKDKIINTQYDFFYWQDSQ